MVSALEQSKISKFMKIMISTQDSVSTEASIKSKLQCKDLFKHERSQKIHFLLISSQKSIGRCSLFKRGSVSRERHGAYGKPSSLTEKQINIKGREQRYRLRNELSGPQKTKQTNKKITNFRKAKTQGKCQYSGNKKPTEKLTNKEN